MPSGAPMSIPACRRPQRCPNGDVNAPLVGQIISPEPCRTGPALAEAGQPGADLRLLLLERDEVALELLAVRPRGDERLALVRADRLVLLAAVESRPLIASTSAPALETILVTLR